MTGARAPEEGPTDPPPLADLLSRHRDVLVRWLEAHASGLRRFEPAEDLAQGVHLHVLQVAEHFEWRGEEAFVGWLLAVARRYVADRAAHWRALKRDAGPMLRITYAGGSAAGGSAVDGAGEGGAVLEPRLSRTGPATWASRREDIVRATRVLEALAPRDADLVRLHARGLEVAEIATHLGLSPTAAQRARLRALERFRKLYALAGGELPPGDPG